MDSETFSCITIGEAEKQQEVLVACGPWWGKHQSLGEEMWSSYIHFPLFVSQLGFIYFFSMFIFLFCIFIFSVLKFFIFIFLM